MNNDLISREALKEIIEEKATFIDGDSVYKIINLIDNAPTVEAKQYELLDYIKLSLKDSDEFKEKYRNKYKESNSQHDLYYSHLFEGMAEAYDDLLKKMSESDTQDEKKQGKWIFKNGKYRCTACGEKAIYCFNGSLAITKTELLTHFCPNCGADMRGEEE